MEILPVGETQYVYRGELNGNPASEPRIVLYENGVGVNNLSFHIAMSRWANIPSQFNASEGTWLFCIDHGKASSTGDKTVGELALSNLWRSYSDMQRELITYALIYGFPNHYENAYGLAATQLIIWEITEGYRTSASQTVAAFSGTFQHNGEAGTAVKEAYDGILSRMQRHTAAPSFGGATVTLRGRGEENAVTLTDTSSLLSADGNTWDIQSGSGVHVRQNGNSLTLWVDDSFAAGAVQSVILGRNMDKTGNAVCLNLNTQEAIAGIPADPVAMALKVTLEEKADLELLKNSDDGKVDGITLELEQWVPGLGYCKLGTYVTANGGKITIPDLEIGTKYRVTEIVPEGYEAEQQVQEITIQAGTNTLTFVNRRAREDLELLKKCDDGKVDGISFKVEQWISSAYSNIGTYKTANGGKITISDLEIGSKYRVTEIVPEGYETEQQVQEITIQDGKNTLTFVNRPLLGSLTAGKQSADGTPMQGVTFRLEYLDGTAWKPVCFAQQGGAAGVCTAQGLTDGCLTTGEDGAVCFSGLRLDSRYRLTEVQTKDGMTLLAEPLFEGVLPRDGERDVRITAINNVQFLLPMSGGSGILPVAFGIALCGAALCAGILLCQKRKSRRIG